FSALPAPPRETRSSRFSRFSRGISPRSSPSPREPRSWVAAVLPHAAGASPATAQSKQRRGRAWLRRRRHPARAVGQPRIGIRRRQREIHPPPLAERELDGVDQLLHVRAVLEVARVLRAVALDLVEE